MAEWLYEAGIGENRAALIEDGEIVEALIERDDGSLKPGDIRDAVLRALGIAEIKPEGVELLLEAVPSGMAEGARLRVLVTREALSEPGKTKRAKGRAAPPNAPVADGPSLLDRLSASGLPAHEVRPHEADRFEDAGWSEVIEQAATGVVAFENNALTISLTPAMTLIDLDGPYPHRLHVEGARAAAAAIRRLGIAGNIGIDFPTTDSKPLRMLAAAAFNAMLAKPFEATAINGFGFMQIIRPRERASLLELLQYDRRGSAARALLRRAQRSGLTGAVELALNPAVAGVLECRGDWLDTLGTQLGGAVRLRRDPSLGIFGGHVSSAR